jgi:hypothetical protein
VEILAAAAESSYQKVSSEKQKDEREAENFQHTICTKTPPPDDWRRHPGARFHNLNFDMKLYLLTLSRVEKPVIRVVSSLSNRTRSRLISSFSPC